MTQACRRKGRKILGTLAPEKRALFKQTSRDENDAYLSLGQKVWDFLRPHRLQKVCISSKNTVYLPKGSGSSLRDMQMLQ